MKFSRLFWLSASLLLVLCGNAHACLGGTYEIDGKCCPKCDPGSRVIKDCTEFAGTSCQLCAEMTFVNTRNGQKNCFPCSNCDAASGLEVNTRCTATSDTVCGPLEGFFCYDSDEDGCKAAQNHKRCSPGEYTRGRGTPEKDTECLGCEAGTFSDGTSCQPHTNCEELHLQLLKPGTASEDAACGEKEPNSDYFIIGIVVVFVIIAVLTIVILKKTNAPSKRSII